MAEVLIEPKVDIGIMIEADVVTPENFAGKSREEIERLQVWQGPVELPLGDFFDVEVRGAGSPEDTTILIEGDATRVKHIGHGMKAGRIEAFGSVGMHAGSEMIAGSILVRGNAGSWAGMEMKSGSIRIEGDAGDHVGCVYRGSWKGMMGGEILIEGNAKSQLGGGMTGGKIVVAGDVENFCGIRQSGGQILVKGSAVRGLGAEMTGGAIAVLGEIEKFTPGFLEETVEANPALGEVQLEGAFAKFAGDYAISKNPKGILYVREGS